MKNELNKIVIASSLAICALAFSSFAYAQPKSLGIGELSSFVSISNGGAGLSKVSSMGWRDRTDHPQSSICLRKANTYSPRGKCECTVRMVSRNGDTGNYEVCNLYVKLNHRSLTLKTFQPTS